VFYYILQKSFPSKVIVWWVHYCEERFITRDLNWRTRFHFLIYTHFTLLPTATISVSTCPRHVKISHHNLHKKGYKCCYDFDISRPLVRPGDKIRISRWTRIKSLPGRWLSDFWLADEESILQPLALQINSHPNLLCLIPQLNRRSSFRVTTFPASMGMTFSSVRRFNQANTTTLISTAAGRQPPLTQPSISFITFYICRYHKGRTRDEFLFN